MTACAVAGRGVRATPVAMACARGVVLVVLAALAASAGEAPRGWISWSAWKPMDLEISYFNVVPRREGRIGLWFDASMRERDAVIGLDGEALDRLPKVAPRFDGTLIRGYDRDLLGRASPIISRSSATRLADGSWIVQASIGPTYGAGGKLTELLPVLFASPSGAAGTWTYLGLPAGEPARWIEQQRAAKALIRSDGGSIVQLPDGTLRMYAHGYGPKVAVLDAPTVAGPWTFRRSGGAPLDAAAGLPGGTWLFPHVVPIGDRGWLMTGGDRWPPTELWAARSRDGLTFAVPGAAAPVLTPPQVAPGAGSLKCLRAAWNAERGVLEAVANAWDPKRRQYRLHCAEGTIAPGALDDR